MGETRTRRSAALARRAPFSILKRIVMGETSSSERNPGGDWSFSILKRIVMGETPRGFGGAARELTFQYPQADRDG